MPPVDHRPDHRPDHRAAGGPRDRPTALVRSVRALTRLVLPVACPGCGRADVPCCAPCAAALATGVRRVEHAAPRLDRVDGVSPLPVWALAPYADVVRELVLAWKDHGRTDADRVLAPAVRRAARGIAPALGAVRHEEPGPVLVVPAPSTAASRRARGRDHVAVLARAAAAGLRDAGVPARAAPVLARRGRGRDQVGLGARGRARNLAGAVVVRRRRLGAAPPRRPVCLLVDDVVTTGATLAAAERALEAAGAAPVGALVVAATPPPGAARSRHVFATGVPVPVSRSVAVGLAWGSDGGYGARAAARPTHERAGP